jgi:flagellar biogenesis protein FliO
VATVLLLVAGGAFVVVRSRGGQLPWATGMAGHSIDILAVRALGHKHRLVLVDAAGERLLLSATEHEVRLLSHVASSETSRIEAAADPAQVGALAQSMQPMAGVAPVYHPAPQPQPNDMPVMATEVALPAGAAVPPAPGGSLSAEALYEGAARSMDLDEHDEDAEAATAASPAASDGLASDVAGLARWRQAAAQQGADAWGKQL